MGEDGVEFGFVFHVFINYSQALYLENITNLVNFQRIISLISEVRVSKKVFVRLGIV